MFRFFRNPVPARSAAGRADWLRAAIGGMVVIGLSSALLTYCIAGPAGSALLLAPMGASVVLLLALPASPLAQPWSVVGGNCVSALVGAAIAQVIGQAGLAAPVAVGCAMAFMFMLRCLHPPGGALALMAALNGAGQAGGQASFLWQVLLGSALITACASGFHRLTGRSYPHRPHEPQHPHHPTPSEVLDDTDFEDVLADYGDALDISPGDLRMLYDELRGRAEQRQAKASD